MIWAKGWIKKYVVMNKKHIVMNKKYCCGYRIDCYE